MGIESVILSGALAADRTSLAGAVPTVRVGLEYNRLSTLLMMACGTMSALPGCRVILSCL